MNLRQLLEKRSALVADMRGLTSAPAGEGGDLSLEQENRFNTMKADLESLEKQIQRQALLDEAERRMQGEPLTGSGDNQLDTELRSFSLVRAIAGQCPDSNVDWGRERELSQELQRRSGRSAQGVMVPMQVFEQRAITTTTPTAGPGGNLVPTELLAGQHVDRLRARLVIARLGARVLNGLTGNVDIPGLKGSSTSGWVAENQALSQSEAQFRKVSMAPKHAGAITELSRNMLQQASPDIEQLVRDDFAAILAEAIDRVAIQGGGSNEPVGILATPGLDTEAFAPATAWASVQDFIGRVEDRNVNIDSCAFMTSPGVVTALRQFERTSESFIMETRNSLDGYNVARTTLCPAETLVFGDFSDLIIGYWSGFDLLVNPFESSAYSKGNVLVRAMLTCDTALRHVESFGALTGVKVA